jgi:hypothetical protein
MSETPTARFTVITLGVTDIRASIALGEALGFVVAPGIEVDGDRRAHLPDESP